MTSTILSIAQYGLHCQRVSVEADVSRHVPSFVLVGLPDAAIQEARERIRSAIENSDLPFPRTKVTVNLAPANVRKEGTQYDLAIAISILQAHESITLNDDDRSAIFMGELSLSGLVRPVKGVLVAATFAREQGIRRMYVPEANAREASYIDGVEVIPVPSLSALVNHFLETVLLPLRAHQPFPVGAPARAWYDFADVRGQQQAKRALEIAAAGGHNVLLSGIPGSGKTMLAKAMMSIMPPLDTDEMLEVSKIYSYAGLLSAEPGFIDTRPFRSPHHTASVASIVGGGTWPKPGEITLAHRGVLFLDEFPEFPRGVLEALRQPLEDKIVTISRVSGSLQFPAHCMLLAAQNPCPCGAWGDSEKACVCSVFQRMQYQRRVSGPVMDRIDLHVHVYPVKRESLLNETLGESSVIVLERVLRARDLQRRRFAGSNIPMLNSDMSQKDLKKFCLLTDAQQQLLIAASQKLQLSARSFYKMMKIARTIADLAGRDVIDDNDILEALQYRQS